MRIEIRLCNILAQCRRGGGDFALTVPDGTTLDDALRRMSLRRGRLAAVLCNGRSMMDAEGQIDGARILQEGDHLVISANDREAMAGRSCLPLAFLAGGLRRISALLSPLVHTR